MSSDPRNSSLVVLPTEWDKMDVVALFVFNELNEKMCDDANNQLSIEKVPVFRNRDLCCCVSFALWAMYMNITTCCSIGS